MWKGKMRHLEERSLEAERPALGNEKESLLKPWVYNLLVSMCLKIVTNNPEPKFSFKKCDMQIDSSQIYMKCINEHRFFYWLKEKSRIFNTDPFQRSLLTSHLVHHYPNCAAAATSPPLSLFALGTLLKGAVKVKALQCFLNGTYASFDLKWHSELINNQVVASSLAKSSCPA